MVVITLLAPALGGATQLWAQALLTLCCVSVIMLSPPRHLPPRPVLWAFLGLLLLLGVSFLPASWFGTLPWRQAVTPPVGIDLPFTLSPQPRLTLEKGLLLGTGLLWLAYLVTREWTLRRRFLLSIYAGGVALLAGTALLCLIFDWLPPFWQPYRGKFGFFPNRNQTANVMALGGILTLALAFHEFARRRDMRFIWTAAYLLIGVALVLDGSRSGILLFLGGSLIWVNWTGWGRQEMKFLSLGSSVVLLALTLFCIYGGKTLDRLSQLPEENDGRILIQSDALRLLQDASWHGVGLGNFSPLFTHYRRAYFAQNRAVHPESDWLWLGIEMGWISLALVLFGLGYWLVKHFPRPSDSDFKFRAALLVCVLGFLMHGLVDVSGHRMGSVFPALLFLGLLPSQSAAASGRVVPALAWTSPVAWGYRSLCGVYAVIALWWLLSGLPLNTPVTTASLLRLKARIKDAQAFQADAQVDRLAAQGLRYAPLDWELYFSRALSGLRISEDPMRPFSDFRRALHLEPNVADLPFVEGVAWLLRQPRLSLGPWREALRRTELTDKTGGAKINLYARMLTVAEPYTVIRDDVRALALDDHRLMLHFMKVANREEFLIELQRMLMEDPELKTLNPAERELLFSVWARKGDREELEQQIQAHPDWLQSGWFWLAANQARREEYQSACEMAQRLAAPPTLPPVNVQKPLSELRMGFLMLSNDVSIGYALFQAELRAGQTNDALHVLQRVTAQRSCPLYFHYLEARLWMERGDWPKAWRSWVKFLGKS